MKYLQLVCLCLAALSVFTVSAAADLIDFQVNDDGLAVTHERPRVVTDHTGKFWVAWSDQRNGHSDVFVQRFSATGQPLGSNQRINTDSSSAWHMSPAIDCGPSNEFMVVWQDYRNGAYPFGADIYYQRFDSSSTALGPNTNSTIELPDSLKENPDISFGPDGRAVVVWADYRNRNWDIYGQIVNGDGSLSGSNFKINDDQNLAQQHSPRISVSPQGWFVVAWYDNRQGNDDIFVQRFDQAAARVGINRRVNSDLSTTRQAFPDIAADARGHFSVVWTDWRNGTYPANPDIYFRRFDTAYQPLCIDTRANMDASARAQRDPAIAADRMGNIAIVWADSGATSWDISGQMIGADGAVHVASFRANSRTDSAQIQPDVSLDGRDRYVTWVDKRSGTFDIYASVAKYNDARLTATPSAVHFDVNAGGPLPVEQQIVIEHVGYNPLGFKVISSQAWLQCAPSPASTPETVNVSVQQLLPVGAYQGDLIFIDTASHDSSLTVSVTMTITVPASNDSVIVGAVALRPQHTIFLPVDLYLTNAMQAVTIPLAFDSTLVSVTSISLGAALTARATVTTLISSPGIAVLRITAIAGDSLPPGRYEAALIQLTATSAQGLTNVDTATSGGYSLSVSSSTGSLYEPVFVSGQILVDVATETDEPEAASLPDFALGQNYPNPFNLATHIDFSLPAPSEVILEIFNILGQRVAVVERSHLVAGQHSSTWEGYGADGLSVPSGIYFYRLQAGNQSSVRKMIVLK